MITGKYPGLRLRRNRKHPWSRKLVQENTLMKLIKMESLFIIEKALNQ